MKPNRNILLLLSFFLFANIFSQINEHKIQIGVNTGIGKGNLIPHNELIKNINYQTCFNSNLNFNYLFNTKLGINTKILYLQLPINNEYFYFGEVYGDNAIIQKNTGYFNLMGLGFNFVLTTNKKVFNLYTEIGINLYYPVNYRIDIDKELNYQKKLIPALNNKLGFSIKLTDIISIQFGGVINYSLLNFIRTKENIVVFYVCEFGLIININK